MPEVMGVNDRYGYDLCSDERKEKKKKKKWFAHKVHTRTVYGRTTKQEL